VWRWSAGLFAATVINSFGIRAERATVTVVLTQEGCNPRSSEPRPSGNHLECDLIIADEGLSEEDEELSRKTHIL
jgi:hypothetical protein